jgi:hypothetical protein
MFAGADKGGLAAGAAAAGGGQPSDQYTYTQHSLDLLGRVRADCMRLLLSLCCAQIGLSSCFVRGSRQLYKERIRSWTLAVKLLSPAFFYMFIWFVLLAVWQEPFYVGRGMCSGRCLNRTDCHAEQNIGLTGADNALGHWDWVSPKELLSRDTNTWRKLWYGAPECPGTGAVSFDAAGCHQCAWLAQLTHVDVRKPVFFTASDNSTLCMAEVCLTVLDGEAGSLPAVGTAVPAVWTSMTNGRNDNYSTQLADRLVSYTNATGCANFTSPLSKPFNRTVGCYGCNLTVLASEATGFMVAPGSILNNSVSWGCVNCVGVWQPPWERVEQEAPCDADCESYGNRTQTFHIIMPGTPNGTKCVAAEGAKNFTACRNQVTCDCTGEWRISKWCDAGCQQWGTLTQTYHITKAAMSRRVRGRDVTGAECEAKDQQAREQPCFNNQSCSLHADVFPTTGGQGVHGDLTVTQHPRP